MEMKIKITIKITACSLERLKLKRQKILSRICNNQNSHIGPV